MFMYCYHCTVLLILQLTLVTYPSASQLTRDCVGPPTTSDQKSLKTISAPVFYMDTMLLVTTKHGAGAIVFGKVIKKGVDYRFRWESKCGKVKKSGTGTVREWYKLIPTKDPNVFIEKDLGTIKKIKAGKIELQWSYRFFDSGWIYYTPESMTVQIGSAKHFKTIDLRRFMK